MAHVNLHLFNYISADLRFHYPPEVYVILSPGLSIELAI